MKEIQKQRITANLPKDLLMEAIQTTKRGITDTIILGLEMVKRSRAAEKAKELKGNLHIKLDLGLSRERPHR